MLRLKMPKFSEAVLGSVAGAVLVAMVLAAPVHAAQADVPVLDLRDMRDGRIVPIQGAKQVFRNDLTIEDGEVIDDDVFVYSGDVDLEDGGRIAGDLIVFSGNIDIGEDSGVDGDVTAYSGDVYVAGHIGGDLANMNGNVELASTAQVEGDISVVSGDIERDEEATVGGNVVEGPSFSIFRRAPFSDSPRDPRGLRVDAADGSGFFGTVFGFIARLFVAALITTLGMLLVGGLFYLRPQLIVDTLRNLKEQLALSAIVGAIANLTLLFLAGLLALTFCFLPLAVLPMFALLAVNVVGWAAISQIVGVWLVSTVKQEVQPSLSILVGALFLTGICALLWALGGCFRPLAYLLVFMVSSLGTGAVLAPWINRRRNGGGLGPGGTEGPSSAPSGPSPSGAVAPSDTPVDTDPAAPIDYVTAEEINTTAERGAQGASVEEVDSPEVGSGEAMSGGLISDAGEVVEQDVAAPIDYVTAEELNTTEEQEPKSSTAPKSRARGGKAPAATPTPSADETSKQEAVELDVAAPIDYVTAQEVVTSESVSEGDDFLRIKGIGPTYARRLKDAGYLTFAQLAASSPEEIAAAMGWPVDRVRRSEVIDQAQVLARQS